MNTKTLFVQFADGSIQLATLKAKIREAKPWNLSASGKADIDGAVVRALAHRYGFSYGTYESDKAVFSGLAIKSPGKETLDADAKLKQNYGAARKALADARRLFAKPVEHAVASMTDKKHAEAKRLAKFTPEQVKAIVALAAKYRDQ